LGTEIEEDGGGCFEIVGPVWGGLVGVGRSYVKGGRASAV